MKSGHISCLLDFKRTLLTYLLSLFMGKYQMKGMNGGLRPLKRPIYCLAKKKYFEQYSKFSELSSSLAFFLYSPLSLKVLFKLAFLTTSIDWVYLKSLDTSKFVVWVTKLLY